VEDIELGRNTYLKPADIQNLQWITHSNTLSFIRNDSLFKLSPVNNKENLVTTRNQLDELIQKKGISGFPVESLILALIIFLLILRSITK